MSKMLNTGESYPISQLFCGAHTKIVIPDLQRDYCWGGKANLVEEFIKSLIESGFKKDKAKLPLGLIYGYEEPEGHIQLCDGQQRLTTLFLLIGLLNKRCNNDFQQLLISDFEFNEDDKEPYLQYAIRENSLYFISDLVCNFFLKPDGDISKIADESWYFNDYDNDPSIQSMLLALGEIEKTLLNHLDISSDRVFVKYITEELEFMYYDMGGRSSGEETFVIINTTGEPLSPTENLKPRYVTKYRDSAQIWEKWEQWFWVNRDKKINDTADSGLLEFFRWVILLETGSTKTFEETQKQLVKQVENKRFDFELMLEIEPSVIDRYFDVVQKVFAEVLPNNLKWLSPNVVNSQVDWFRILPLIVYVDKYPQATKRDIARVKQFFKNLTQISNITKDIANLLSLAVDMVWQMSDIDIAKTTKVSDRLLTDEEKLKFSIFKESANREEIEELFWYIQSKDGKIWEGEIMPIIKWAIIEEKFDFIAFKQFNDAFYKVFEKDCESNIDPLRRALLTRGLKDYPRCFRGNTNSSFGWEYSDWKRLINENTDEFRLFFEQIINGVTLYDMIAEFPETSEWADFVHIPELLAFCNEKNIQWWGDERGWILVKDRYTSGRHANVNSYKLFLELSDLKDKFWDQTLYDLSFYDYEGSCVVFYNHTTKIVIDIKCVNKDDLFDIEVFLREGNSNSEEVLKEYAENNMLTYNGDRYVTTKLAKAGVIAKLKLMF